MLIIDGHCDTIGQLDKFASLKSIPTGDLDFQRLSGTVDLEFFAIFLDQAQNSLILPKALNLLAKLLKDIEQHADLVRLLLFKDDLKYLGQNDLSYILLAAEGGEILEGDIYLVELLFSLGLRSIILTWNYRNLLADGCGESHAGGLSDFGRAVIQEMNRLGMIVDLSHVAKQGFYEAIDLSQQPVLLSHSGCSAIYNHPRNIDDHQLKTLAAHGGVLGIPLVGSLLSADQPDLAVFMEHLEHAVDIMGIDGVALGSDFDGGKIIAEIKDVCAMPLIMRACLQRGYTQNEVEKIMGGNYYRLLYDILPSK